LSVTIGEGPVEDIERIGGGAAEALDKAVDIRLLPVEELGGPHFYLVVGFLELGREE
jgi:hypothetical protein